ncbi:MAG: S41 family peptidase [Cytophagales bacterium]|nr:S41 family peptidase [Cytophagales bacterium]
MLIIRATYILLIALLLYSCGGEVKPVPTGDNATSCTYDATLIAPDSINAMQKSYKCFNQAVYNVMKIYYLWNNYVKSVDYTQYKDGEALLNELIYTENDRYTFLIDASVVDQVFGEGQSTDMGYRLKLDNENRVRVSYVLPNSPAANAGIKRGALVNKINGQDIDKLLRNNDIGNVMSLSSYTMDIVQNDTARSPSLIAKKYDVNNVIYKNIYQKYGKKIGHFVFYSFVGKASEHVKEVFDYFKSNNVDEVILDLRYNTGGYITVANELATYIGGSKVKDQIFVKQSFNADINAEFAQSGENLDEKFTTLTGLALSRVIILTTDETASASELVINGLKPFMSVVQIGGVTYGKPVGSIEFTYEDKSIFPIIVELFNSKSEGKYYFGIKPNHFAYDDVEHDFGDTNEVCLQSALYYIKTGNHLKSNMRAEAPVLQPNHPLLRSFIPKISILNRRL